MEAPREGSPQGAFTDRAIGAEVPRALTTTTFTLNSFDSRMICMEIGSLSDSGRGKRDTNDNDERVYMHELLAILRGYRPYVFRFLLASFGDPELARTLTQRCTEIAFCKWTAGDDQSLSRKSLMRVAVNLERRHWRKQQLCLWRKTEVKTAGFAHLNNWLPNDQRSIEDQIGAREKIKCVWCAICGLSNEQKIVFLLHCVDEMTSSEIAEVADLYQWKVVELLSEALSRIRATIHNGAGSR